jgi:hypothetical protein
VSSILIARLELFNMDEEKRKSARIKKQIAAKYQRVDDGKPLWLTVLVNNICVSGACISIDRPISIGENILLLLKLPSNPEEWIQINSLVLDVVKASGRTYSARLQFVDLKTEYQNQISEYVDFYLKQENKQ